MVQLQATPGGTSDGTVALEAAREKNGSWQTRFYAFLAFVVGLTAAFSVSLWQLFSTAYRNDFNSYIVLIPVAALYLFRLERGRLSRDYQPAVELSLIPLLIGAGALLTLLWPQIWQHPLGTNDRISIVTTAYVCLLWAGALLLLGKRWMSGAAFPMFFLAFLIPLPEVAVEWMESGLRAASAEAADILFGLIGMPALRTGNIFQLPNITIEVAEECSGIHSSWVLLISGLVAGHLFLSRTWSKLGLLAAVIPLGILRNGVRIVVIGSLCVRYGPEMINSPIHRKGGPLFFVLSLVPFAFLLWILRGRELRRDAPPGAD